PVARRVAGKPGTHVVVRPTCIGDQVQRDVAMTLDTVSNRCDRETAFGPWQEGDARCLANRTLKTQSAGVIGDAAHNVQPPGRAGDEDRIAAACDGASRPR